MHLLSKLGPYATVLAAVLSCAPTTPAKPSPNGQLPAPAASSADSDKTRPAPASELKTSSEQPSHEAVPIEGSELVRGRARVIVHAPITKVRRIVLDFNHYAEFMPHYRQARLLRRTSKGTYEVYMQVAALKGLVKMWTRIKFTRARTEDGIESYESHFLDGNVRDFQAHWRLRAVSAERTELELEVFLHPSLPLPNALLNEENLGGALNGLVAMRERIENTQ